MTHRGTFYMLIAINFFLISRPGTARFNQTASTVGINDLKE